jgi:predicted metal-dependent peptidase
MTNPTALNATMLDSPSGEEKRNELGAELRNAQTTTLTRAISASLLRVRLQSPFFATLAMHARFIESADITTAATDGRDIFYNADFLASLPPQHLDGLLMHEVLHAALGHVTRRSGRDPRKWNVAADIVVNGLIDEQGLELPDSAIRNYELQHYSVEEVYSLLPEDDDSEVDNDLLDPSPNDGGAEGQSDDSDGNGQPRRSRSGGIREATRNAIDKHWQQASSQAAAVARSTNNGSLPAGIERAFNLRDIPVLDWRAVLWRFLTATATDFASFDRRHVHSGLYLETLEDQNLNIAVCIDTSGSLDEALISVLTTEVEGILHAYPGLRCMLFYADAALYGPWELGNDDDIPTPQGGGGTDFIPFFNAINGVDNQGNPSAVAVSDQPSVCIYLTDGYGTFPNDEPRIPTLWVVTPGGLADDQFPFGEVVRLIEE